MNRRAFLLGSAAAAGAQAAEGPGTWVRRAYSFLWTRSPLAQVLYLDTRMIITRGESRQLRPYTARHVIVSRDLDRALARILESKKRLVGEAVLYDRTWTP